MKECPFCAEEIQDEAIKCRFCGEGLPAPSPTGAGSPRLVVVAVTLLVAILVAFAGHSKLEETRAQHEQRGIALEKQARNDIQTFSSIRKNEHFLDILYRQLAQYGAAYTFSLQHPYVEYPIGSSEWKAQGEALQRSSKPAGLAVALENANRDFRRIYGHDADLYLEIKSRQY